MPAAGWVTPARALVRVVLPGAVATDEPDAVTGRDAEGRVVEEQAGAGAQLDGGSGDHEGPFGGWWPRTSGRCARARRRAVAV